MGPLALVLAALAYGCFYAAAPGRQAGGPLITPRPAKIAGVVLTLAALAFASWAYGHGVGSVLVLTVMMTVASALAMVGAFAFSSAKNGPDR